MTKVPDLHLQNDLLVLKENRPLDIVAGRQTKLILPKSLYSTAFQACHSLVNSGHFGYHPTLHRMRSRFYFVGMQDFCRTQVGECLEGRCPLKQRGLKIRDCGYHPRRAGAMGDEIHLDLYGPLPASL